MSWYVTLSSIRNFRKQASLAQDKLSDATEQMKKAAEELCSQWEGDAAVAFAQEQGLLDSWCRSILQIGAEYIGVLAQVLQQYEEAEQEVKNQIGAN